MPALLAMLCTLAPLFSAPSAASYLSATVGGHVTVGWSNQPPYQFQELHGGDDVVTGLDAVLVREAAERAGFTLSFEHVDFARGLEALRDGRLDVLIGAYKSPERLGYARASRPYRIGRDRLFVAAGRDLPAVGDVDALFDALLERRLSIAVARRYDWGEAAGPGLERLDAAGLVRWTDGLAEAGRLAILGEVDGFLGDQLAGLALLRDNGATGRLTLHPLVLQVRSIHMLFSRDGLSAAEAGAFDRALAELDREGRVREIAQGFASALSLSVAFRSDLIDLFFIVGIVAFSISGVVIARTGEYSIFGALVLASLPALGGGVVRDLLLLREIYFFESPEMIYACLLTIAAGYLFNRLLDLLRGRALWFFDLVNLVVYLRRRISPELTMQVFDAAGLALFTVTAVSIAAEEDLAPLWFWGPILGAITATGGAILRDMIRKDAVNPMLHSAFYGEAAVIWSLAYALFLQFLGPYAGPGELLAASLVAMLGIFATRMAFTLLRWRSPRY